MMLLLLHQRHSASARAARPLAILVFSLLLWHPASAASAPSLYRIFDKTQSPRQHYALAWGLPGQSLDWARLDRDEHYLDSLNLDKAANYLVDFHTHRILTTIQGDHATFGDGHFWTTPNGAHPNHFDLSVAWSPNEKMLVALYGGSWNYIDIVACRLGSRSGVSKSRKAISQTRIGDDVASYVRHYLARAQPKVYAQDKNRIAIDAYNARLLDNHHLTLDILVEVPKADGLTFSGQLKLGLYRVGDRLRTRLLSLKASH